MTYSEENGGGSENVVQRNPCSRETLKFRKMFKRSVLNGLEELLSKCFNDRVTVSPESHNLSKCFLHITPVHPWAFLHKCIHSYFC